MISLWVTDSYFNNEPIQIGYIETMTYVYSSSGPFGSRVSSRYIVHNTYTGRRSNSHSKPIPIHGPVHKNDLNYSCSRSHFSRLPQAVSKKRIYRLTQEVIYASKIIYLDINGYSPNGVSSHFHIYDHSIVTFGIMEKIRVLKHFLC